MAAAATRRVKLRQQFTRHNPALKAGGQYEGVPVEPPKLTGLSLQGELWSGDSDALSSDKPLRCSWGRQHHQAGCCDKDSASMAHSSHMCLV